MKKVLASVLILFVLTGCAGTRIGDTVGSIASAVSGFSITQSQVDALRSSYNAAFLVPAAHYRQLPKCSTTPDKVCRNPIIVKQLQTIDKGVLASFNNVQAMIDSGDNSGLSAAWNVLESTVSAAKTYLLTNSIGAQ